MDLIKDKINDGEYSYYANRMNEIYLQGSKPVPAANIVMNISV